ncbi:MAG: ATP-binding cassette domain-containing protein [Acidobacteriota bacterium]|nr:MAG: ATP-binding cassette domain-containing protein [Acidobacteriota bacterium]
MIEARHLTKIYPAPRGGTTVAVQDISFHIERGEVVGFLGPNAAGKTTTMRILTGYLTPNEGCAVIGGYDVSERPIEAKRLMGYLPEHPPLYSDLTVREYLKFAARIKGVARRNVRSRMDYVTDACGLSEVWGRLIGHISKGYHQRVGIAQALIHDPPILILDEPTASLDPKQIVEIRSLIKELGRERTIILSTHILPEVTVTCEKVLIVHRGRLRAEDRIENLLKAADRVWLDVRGADSDEAVRSALEGVAGVKDIAARDGGVEAALEDAGARSELARAVVSRGWALHEMRSAARSLEDVFLELTKEEGR